jgi:hypothetical protein
MNESASNLDGIRRNFTTAFFCGATPLVLGLAICAAWLAYGWHWLEYAGVWVFLGGALLFLFGIGAYLRVRSQIYKLDAADRGRLPMRLSFALLLLMANFPAAAITIGMVLESGRPAEITIVNQTSETMSDVSFVWAGHKGQLGTIPAGEVASVKCRISFFHWSFVQINYGREEIDVEIDVHGVNPLLPLTVTVEKDGCTLQPEHSRGELKTTTYIDLDEGLDDKLIFQRGSHSFELNRVVGGKNKWFDSEVPVGYGDDGCIEEIELLLDGGEIRIDGKTSTKKFFQLRNLSDGKLIESSIRQ